jgi:hypothetical protein
MLRVGAAGEAVWTFQFPNAVQPSSLGNSLDHRRLAFVIWSLCIYRIASETASAGNGTVTNAVENAHSPLDTQVFRRRHADVVPNSTCPKVAAVTMVYNEDVYLPIWMKHYSRQVGVENCYVVDHGSTDGSTENLGRCNVLRIPRSPYDPFKQSAFNSEFCSSLLHWYDWVVYSDVDELVMAGITGSILVKPVIFSMH